MKVVVPLLLLALAACGRSDQAWVEGDSTAFPLTSPGTPVKVEREVIRQPGFATSEPGEELPVDEVLTVESVPISDPEPPPEAPVPPRDTGQALLL